MSQYGPPGGPYPGEPQEPWPARQPQDPYGEPSDPWGGGPQDPWGGQPSGPPQTPPPGYDPPGYGGYDTGYPPPGGYPVAGAYPADPAGAYPRSDPGGQPAWGPPSAPPPGRKRGPIIALVVALVVLVLGGLGTALYLVSRSGNDPTPAAQPSPTSAPATGESSPAAEEPTSAPTPQNSADARFVKQGECVRNEGSEREPRMTIAECDKGTFEVLARFDDATNGEPDAKEKCADVDGYTNWYFFDSRLDSLDFVLCLKQR